MKFWKAFFRKSSLDREMDDEMRFHIEMLAAENRDHGMSVREAEEQARRSFGRADRYREECRSRMGVSQMEGIWQDTIFAARWMRRNPGFTLMAVLSLALSAGASTAIYSFVRGVLLQPLPYPDSDRLVYIWEYDRLAQDRERGRIDSRFPRHPSAGKVV